MRDKYYILQTYILVQYRLEEHIIFVSVAMYTVGWVLIVRFFSLRIANFSITRNQKNRRKKNMQLIIYCPLGNSQSLKSQFGLYSTIRNCLTTQSKPDLQYESKQIEHSRWTEKVYLFPGCHLLLNELCIFYKS